MYDFWATSTINMTYMRLQNYTDLVIDQYVIQIFKVMFVMLLLCSCHLMFLSQQVHIPYFFGQVICPNILKYQFTFVLDFLCGHLTSNVPCGESCPQEDYGRVDKDAKFKTFSPS